MVSTAAACTTAAPPPTPAAILEQPATTGVFANLYLPPAPDTARDAAVLVLGGSEGGFQIRSRSQQQAPELVELTGCGPLTAAKLVAETAGTPLPQRRLLRRPRRQAPIPVSSGNHDRVRLSRGGNRQLNLALHRMALTQARIAGPGRDYYQRKQTEGHTKTEALRALERKIARAVYKALRRAATRQSTSDCTPALT